MKDLIVNIEKWAFNKGLLKTENSFPQFTKVVEEVSEIGSALSHKSQEELIDAIGDTFVTITILATQNGLSIEDCVEHAWNQIKDRKGTTVNGTFIKETT